MNERATVDNVRGVVFDLFGTLTDGSVEAERGALYAELAGVLEVPREPFVRLMRETFHDRSVGAFGGVRQTLARLAAALGREADERTLDAAVELRLEIERRLAKPREDSVSVLRALGERGLAVCVISDCGPETPSIWPSLPFAGLVTRPVFSCDLRVRKPHPSLYELAASRLGLAPRDCLYVGDGGSRELTGALAAGMRAVRLAVSGEDWGADIRYEPDDGFSGAFVPSLSALLELWATPHGPGT
ncbi:MAG TPA: HAD family hydrolase [Pyrinomonadaceae bacterium]|nr:HAD family hydrolase [Pyrinomonadaceae bacterium]